jgi:hypothetical protein
MSRAVARGPCQRHNESCLEAVGKLKDPLRGKECVGGSPRVIDEAATIHLASGGLK